MFLKKTIIIFVLAAFIQNSSLGQSIFGRVIDSSTNQAIEFATIGLYTSPSDSLITGVITKSNGYFSFFSIADGTYTIRIQFIGYQKLEKKITINSKISHADLGNITLLQDSQLLDEIEVVGEKNAMSLSIDKKTYNVDKDLSVKGGTGLDAVKNIPGVSIDSDGTVTLRNGNAQLYIDGKQTTLTLDQIPSDQIDRIEVMTNPSAKYDANTSGGLLNVVLKKNMKPGYNGSVNAGIGTNQRYTPSVNFNIKQKPFNLTTMFSYSTESNDNKGRTTRDNITNPVPIKHFEQTSLSDFNRTAYVGNISLDYTINNRNTITIGERYINATYRTTDEQNYFSEDASDAIYSTGNRDNENINNYQRYASQLSYKKTFPKKGMELTADAKYTYGTRNGEYEFNTNDTILGVHTIAKQINDAGGNSQLGTFQIDFTNPINDSSKIEFGIKTQYKDSRNTNITSNYSTVTNTFLYDSSLSNDFVITEIVNAAYINYTRRVKKIDIQAGLRFEQVEFTGAALNKSDEKFGYSYPADMAHILNAIFPAIYFSKKVNEKNEFQLNVTRKLNRPRFYYLLPIVFFADKFNYRIGNPNLQPEFVNKAEINYNFVKPTFNYLTAVYGQVTENSILYGAYQSNDDASVLINTFVNGGISYTLGWENIARITSIKNLTLSATLTPYYILVNYIDVNGVELKNEGFSLNSKWLVSYKLPKDFTLQLNGLYEAPKPIPQGNKTDLFFFDVSLSKKIKKKFIFSIVLSDVMDTKQRGTVYSTPDYEQFLIRRRESRYLKFNATWMFGKSETKRNKQNTYNE